MSLVKSESEKPDTRAAQTGTIEPPEIYFAACGALCDVFWWARRKPAQSRPRDSD